MIETEIDRDRRKIGEEKLFFNYMQKYEEKSILNVNIEGIKEWKNRHRLIEAESQQP